MPIKRSASSEVRSLVDALLSDDEVARESAIARVAIIGSRAMDRLLAAYHGARDRDARIAVLRAIEPLGDRRAGAVAAGALKDGGDVALAAIGVLRGLLDSSHTPTATAALDALVSLALDRAAEHRLRVVAFEALQDVPGGVRQRVGAALGQEVNPPATDTVWADALAGILPDDPAALRDPLRVRSASAPLTVLHKMVDAARAKEAAARSAARRASWRALRGALHQALALRGSRVALYDLRETVAEATEPLPVSYLAAMHVVGDASCLEALAAAHARAQGDDWWKHQLTAAFHAIVKRERITKRHAVFKRIRTRWPAAATELAGQ